MDHKTSCTPYSVLHGEALPKRGAFFVLLVYAGVEKLMPKYTLLK